MRYTIYYHLYNVKNVKSSFGEVLQLRLLQGCFSDFLNLTIGTKLCKASHMFFEFGKALGKTHAHKSLLNKVS